MKDSTSPYSVMDIYKFIIIKDGRFASNREEKQTLPGIQETEEPGVTHLAEQNPSS